MGDQITAKVVGADVLARRLKALVGIPRMLMVPIVAKYALQLQTLARQLVKVDLGDTRRSILTQFLGQGLTAAIGSDAKTAVWLEKGTKPHFPPPSALAPWCARHGMKPGAEWAVARKIALVGTKPSPFLEPAFLQVAPYFVGEANAQLGQAIENVTRS